MYCIKKNLKLRVQKKDTKMRKTTNEFNKLTLLKKKVDPYETIDLLYDPDTDIEYWRTNNGIQMRVNTDGSPYTLTRPNAFKDTLPYIIGGGIFLILFMLAADFFEFKKIYYSSCLMWFFFIVIAFFIVSKILGIIKDDIKVLPSWNKKVWTPDVALAYFLLFILAIGIAYLASVLNIEGWIDFVIKLIK